VNTSGRVFIFGDFEVKKNKVKSKKKVRKNKVKESKKESKKKEEEEVRRK